ncbi:MAG: hypothetical protein WAR59_04780 [Ignavibacteriaceae bacterium]
MKRLFIYLTSIILLIGSALFVGCSEDATPSIYDVIKPSETLPMTKLYDFDSKTTGIPYAITVDDQGIVYVSIDKKGIKKIVSDTLAVFAPYSTNAPFFKSISMASDGKIYGVRTGIKGVYVVAENTGASTFVANSQGIADKLNDIDFDGSSNTLWSGGDTGIIYRITLDKNVKKFFTSGNISAVKVTGNYLYIALSDTNSQEVVWKFPKVSVDSLGEGQLIFNLSANVDTLAKITDLGVSSDGDVYVCTNKQGKEMFVVHSDLTFEEFYNGLFVGTVFSFVWGNSTNAFFTNTLLSANTDVWKIDMKKNKAQ